MSDSTRIYDSVEPFESIHHTHYIITIACFQDNPNKQAIDYFLY